MEDMTVGRERVREFGIVRRATAVTSVMVNDATNRGVPFAYADESPTIAHDSDGNSVRNGGAGASARGSTSKDEDDGEQ